MGVLTAKKIRQGLEQHVTSNWLRDVILGGQDGLVNVLGIVLGVGAAGGSPQILTAAAMAATFAEAVSMAAVEYTSAMADKERYQKELAREYEEVERIPETERQEVRAIYQAKGFSGKLLEEIVGKITADRDVWVNIMMKEELGLTPVETNSIVRSSLIVGLAAVVGSLVPVWPYFLFPIRVALVWSLVVSTAVLFMVGVYKARSYVGSPAKSGLQMAVIGMGAAVVGFLVGKVFNTV